MHPFHLFAHLAAERLPGKWVAQPRSYDRRLDQSIDTGWIWPLRDDRPGRAPHIPAALLLGPDGLLLYLVEHRQGRALVCPVVPLGLNKDITVHLPAPPSVAVPLDPARAAWRISDRVLPEYTAAVADAREAAAALAARRAHNPAPLPAPLPSPPTRNR
ncbi:hypothetical protein ABZ135_28390 [Streptomyces sp. NPDC006339]|uniref:hypothetical protein n=1 Tax=Streptomyces sp. NPDC006339 TaxID=3156755 RepID=UPI0033A39510